MSFVRSVCATAVAAAAVAGLAVPPASAAPPGDMPVSELLKNLQTLYMKTEAASEEYNRTAEKLKKQRARVKKSTAALRDARRALAESRVEAGDVARQQYRGNGAGIPSSVQLLLSRHPQGAIEHGHQLKRAAGSQAATVERLTRTEHRQSELTTRARKAWKEESRLAAKQKKQRDTVKKRLQAVESMLASLTGEELAELRRLEAEQMASAQKKLMSAGVLGAAQPPSAAGRKALKYAIDQIGKPYVWGAEGPDSFDCSGLTSQAWLRADRPVPRTSQEQWRQLPRVPLDSLRPGDLVIYFKDATHVGLYLGGGKVVQAPRPKAVVKVSPIAANPLLGAVRPDKGAKPLKDYRPPRLPADAEAPGGNGDDTGYSSPTAPGS